MSRLKWVSLFAVAIGFAAAVWIGTGRQTPAPRSAPRLDKSRPTIDLLIPVLDLAKDHQAAFVLPKELVLPPRCVVRIKGTFRTGMRSGSAQVIAETIAVNQTGRRTMTGNGASTVRMRPNTECEYEVLLFQPKRIRDSELEVRVGNELIAKGRIRPTQ